MAIKAPQHLSRAAQRLWMEISEECGDELPPSMQAILTTGLESWDNLQRFRAQIAKDGDLVANRFDELKPHPLIMEARHALAGWQRAYKLLNLDLDETK